MATIMIRCRCGYPTQNKDGECGNCRRRRALGELFAHALRGGPAKLMVLDMIADVLSLTGRRYNELLKEHRREGFEAQREAQAAYREGRSDEREAQQEGGW